MEEGIYQDKEIRVLRLSGIVSALKFYNYVYKDANYALKRKFRKFLRLINYCRHRKFTRHKDEINTELLKAIEITKYILKNSKF